MSEISINGSNYNLEATGKIKVKDVKSADEVKNDLNDDIVVKDKSGKLKSISADELDISGTWMKPFVGMPSVGSHISFVDDAKHSVDGKVVFAEDENDIMTKAQKNFTETKDTVVENTKEFVKTTKEEYNKAVEYYSNPPKQNDTVLDRIKKEYNEIKKEINKNETVQEAKKEIKEIKKEISNDPAVKELKKEINNSKPLKETGRFLEKTIGIGADIVNDIKEQQLTLGRLDTHKEGNFDISITASKNPTINGSYTFDVKKLEENVSIFNENGKLDPSSEILFVSQSVGASVGPNQVSANYRANLGIEFSKPLKNDFSFSAFAGPEVGFRPQGGAFLGMAMGVEGRTQLDDNITLFGGPVLRGTLIGDEGKGKQLGLEAGINIKF